MKKIFLTLIIVAISIITNAQKTYQTYIDKDSTTKIFKGLLSKEVLQYEPSFTWYAPNAQYYNADSATVKILKDKGNLVQIMVFGGTWCEDTQGILPKFFKLSTVAGFNQANITLWGVDRTKKTYGALSEAMGVTRVPTFIVMQNGKELGRVIEYGKTGNWDKEIGEIVALAK
jgi:thiol-disulfide isomerase/thioredoxin